MRPARRAARHWHSLDETGAATGATITWAADGLDDAHHRPGRQPAHDEGLSGHDQHVDDDRDRRRLVPAPPTMSTSTPTATTAVYTRTAAYTISGPGITTTTIKLTDPANTNFSGDLHAGGNVERQLRQVQRHRAAGSR